jgi:hypothetical protein
MKTTSLFAIALALGLSINTFAQQADNTPSPAAKTRAQVIEELKEAQQNGTDMPRGFVAFHAPKLQAPASKEQNPSPTKVAATKSTSRATQSP